MFKKYQLSICSLFLAGLLLLPISAVSADEDVVAPSSETEQVVEEPNESSEVVADETVTSPSSETEPVTEDVNENAGAVAEEETITEASEDGSDSEETDPVNPTTVFGPDDRVRVTNPSLIPYRQTVFINVRFDKEYFSGTGVLIGPNKVLTAAHILRHKETGRWANEVTVVPGRSGEITPYDIRRGSTYHIYNTYYNDSSIAYTIIKQQNDLAVITLDEPFSPYVGYLSVNTVMSLNQRVEVIGYPGSKADASAGKIGYMYRSRGPILEINEKTIAYQVDTTEGHSGGPVVDMEGNIIAINVAETPKKNIARRMESDAVGLIEYANNNLPTNQQYKKFIPVYQLFNPQKGYYFYTIHRSEKERLETASWQYQGVTWSSNTQGGEIYRYYSPSRNKHIFTAQQSERERLEKTGWRYEGVAFYSHGKYPAYRLFHGKDKTHYYTANEVEKNRKIKEGWHYEGVAWYVE